MQSNIWENLPDLLQKIFEIYPFNFWGLFFAINTVLSIAFAIYLLDKLVRKKTTWLIPFLVFIGLIIFLMGASGSIQGAKEVLYEFGSAFLNLFLKFQFGLWGSGLGLAAILTAASLVYLLEKLKKWHAIAYIRPLSVLGLIASTYVITNGIYWFYTWDPNSTFVQEFLNNTVTVNDLFNLDLISIFKLKEFLQDQLIKYWPPVTIFGGILGCIYYGMCSLNPRNA